MTHITKKLLVNSLIKLPVELVDIIKDYVFMDKVQQYSKNQKDITLHYLIQSLKEVYEIYDNEYIYLYGLQTSICHWCGNYRMDIDDIKYPRNIKCIDLNICYEIYQGNQPSYQEEDEQ